MDSQLDLANKPMDSDQIPDTLTSVSECGFCCVKADDMKEPRTMPCGHIYCAPCIEGHFNPVTAETECKICSEKFKNLVVEELNPSAKAADIELKCLCDVCETADAIRYCVEDQQKLCDEHLKIHDDYLKAMKKKTHTLVTIEDLYKAPRRYTKHYCTDHPDIELSGACQQCMKVFCIYDIPGKCDAVTDNEPHLILPIKQLTTNIKSELRTTMDTLNEKRQKGYDHIKQALRGLSEEESNCDKIKEEISAHAKKMEEIVHYQANKAVDRVHEHLQKCNSQVENYVEVLEVALTVFDDALTNGLFLTKQADDLEVLERYKDSSKELGRLLKDNTVEKALNLCHASLIKGQPEIDIALKLSDVVYEETEEVNYKRKRRELIDRGLSILSPEETLEQAVAYHAYTETSAWMNEQAKKCVTRAKPPPASKALPTTIGVPWLDVAKKYSEVAKSFGYHNLSSKIFKYYRSVLNGDYKIALGKLREVSLLSYLEQAELCETNLRRDSEKLESQLKNYEQIFNFARSNRQPSQNQFSYLQTLMGKR